MAHHGRGFEDMAVVAKILFILFFLCFFPISLASYKNTKKLKAKKKRKEKELGLPPKKHSFKVKSLTLLLFLVQIR